MWKVLLFLGTVFSTTVLTQNTIQYNFETKTFYAPDTGPYLETHLNFLAGTMKYSRLDNNQVQARIEALILVKKEEEIIQYEKVEILSPATTDSTIVDFIDLRRFVLTPETYELEVQLKDLNSLDSLPIILTRRIEIPNFQNTSVGDLILLSAWNKTTESNSLSRSGIDMIPRMSNYFDSESSKIGFYTELYHTNKLKGDPKKYALATYFEKANGKLIPQSLNIKKQEATGITPLFLTKSMDYLGEGQYNLVVEIRSQKNEAIANKKIQFIKEAPRSIFQVNPKENGVYFAQLLEKTENDLDLVQSLLPIANTNETNTIQYVFSELADPLLIQNFISNFWKERNPSDPIGEWEKYQANLEAVDNDFGTRIRSGFETDRGYIYLKYGAPNTRVVRPNDVGAVPYEIWHYYKAGRFSNRRFVFIDSDMSINDYRLIQSDVPGEANTPNWLDLMIVNQSGSRNQGIENQNSNDSSVKRLIQDLYLNPR